MVIAAPEMVEGVRSGAEREATALGATLLEVDGDVMETVEKGESEETHLTFLVILRKLLAKRAAGGER